MAEQFAKNFGVPVDWQPYLLRPDAPREGWALPDRIKAMKNRPDNPLNARAKQLGLTLVEREWIPNSRRALAANEHIRKQGLEALHAYHSAVNVRYWSKGEDLSQLDVLEGAAKDAGLDTRGLREAVENDTFEQTIDDSIAKAHAMGIHAVPTYVFFDGEKPIGAIQGAQEYAVFERAAAQLGLKKHS
ncbi:MAG: DsbA family protein [Myxococcaceae bacterium]|nr:DsbA family protein [Myxococcaceae bacterium]